MASRNFQTFGACSYGLACGYSLFNHWAGYLAFVFLTLVLGYKRLLEGLAEVILRFAVMAIVTMLFPPLAVVFLLYGLVKFLTNIGKSGGAIMLGMGLLFLLAFVPVLVSVTIAPETSYGLWRAFVALVLCGLGGLCFEGLCQIADQQTNRPYATAAIVMRVPVELFFVVLGALMLSSGGDHGDA